MSFRNSNPIPNEKIKIQDSHLSSQFLSSSKYAFNEQEGNEEILKKISSIIVSLHEGYLLKCRNIQIYRDLSEEEQNLLLTVEKNTAIHTALAGILAIDSCVKCIDKEEAFIISNMIRGVGAIVGQFKSLEKELAKQGNGCDYYTKLGDSIRYLIQQLYCMPSARGREDEQEKQLNTMDKYLFESNDEEEYQQQYQKLLGDLQRENQVLKVGLREKDGYISMLESRYERGMPRFQKLQEKKTSHSLAFRISTEKSSENQSNSASMQHLYEQISHLKEELEEKNNIVIKMNEEFASEMQKYNSVFKRIEEENRLLKRYSDVDTAYMLEELEYEIEILREEKRKDQMIIGEIQRKIEGISMTRSSRINTRQGYELPNRQYAPEFNNEHVPHFEHRPPFENRYSKFYSPNYATRLSPYSRATNVKEQMYGYQPQETYRSNLSNINRKMRLGETYTRKSRNKLTHSKQPKDLPQAKSNPHINLYERVMSKRM